MIGKYSSSPWMPSLSAILLSLALPWVGLTPLVFVALVPLFIFLRGTAKRNTPFVLASLLSVFIYNIVAVYPLMHVAGAWWTGTHDLNRLLGENVQYTIMVIATAAWRTLLLFPAVFVAHKVFTHRSAPLLIATSWVLLEWVCANITLWGYSVGVLGYSLAGVPYIEYLSALGGVYLLSFIIVLINAAAAEVLMTARSVSGAFRHPWFVFVCVALVVTVSFGVHSRRNIAGDTKAYRVAVVGTTLTTEQSISEAGYRSYHEKLTQALRSEPDLVLLPENAFPYFEINEDDGSLVQNTLVNFSGRDALYDDLLSLSRLHASTTLAIGIHTIRNKKHYNSIVFFRNGIPRGYYEKRVLVPFTEFAPAGLKIPLAVHLRPGAMSQPFVDRGVTISGLICSEIAVTNIRMGDAAVILAPSNDSIFLGAPAARMHDAAARLRAIEHHAYLLRADKGGVSSIIDPKGRIVAETTDGVITATLAVPHSASGE